MIECQHCKAITDETEGRCSRCGRRVIPANPRPAPEGYIPSERAGTGAAAALDLDARAFETPFETLEGGRAGEPGARIASGGLPGGQQALFREGNPSGKVIPIPTLMPARRSGPPRDVPRRNTPGNLGSQPRIRAARAGELSQQELFHRGEPSLAPSNEAICCDAAVAVPVHRMMAAAMDTSLILIATGVVLGVFLFAGGEMVLNRQTAPLMVGVVGVLALFYRILWVIADGDTPGMRFAGLRLVDFDGRKPHREARLLRQAAVLLSLCSLGLGLVWALVDEESLTWHDHISKTFPTVE